MLSQAPEPASKALQRAILIFSAFRQLEGVPRALPLPHKNLSWGRWWSGLKLSHRVPPPSTYERSSTARDRAWGWGREMFPRLPEARRCTGWDVQSSGCLTWGPGWLGSSAGDSGLALQSRESVSQERRVCAGEAPQGEGCRSSSGHFVLLNASQQFCINKGVNSAWNMAKASRLSFHWYKLNWIKY